MYSWGTPGAGEQGSFEYRVERKNNWGNCPQTQARIGVDLEYKNTCSPAP